MRCGFHVLGRRGLRYPFLLVDEAYDAQPVVVRRGLAASPWGPLPVDLDALDG